MSPGSLASGGVARGGGSPPGGRPSPYSPAARLFQAVTTPRRASCARLHRGCGSTRAHRPRECPFGCKPRSLAASRCLARATRQEGRKKWRWRWSSPLKLAVVPSMCVIEFGEFAVIFEWLLIQVVFGNGLKALGLWSCDFVGDFSRFVGDAAKICEE